MLYSDTVQRLWVCWCHFYKNPTLKLHKHAEAGGMKIVSPRATWPRIQCIPIACSPTDKARWKEDSKDVSKRLLKYCWVYEHSGLLNPGEQERKVPVSLTMPPRQGAISVGESIISVDWLPGPAEEITVTRADDSPFDHLYTPYEIRTLVNNIPKGQLWHNPENVKHTYYKK